MKVNFKFFIFNNCCYMQFRLNIKLLLHIFFDISSKVWQCCVCVHTLNIVHSIVIRGRPAWKAVVPQSYVAATQTVYDSVVARSHELFLLWSDKYERAYHVAQSIVHYIVHSTRAYFIVQTRLVTNYPVCMWMYLGTIFNGSGQCNLIIIII